MNCRNMICIHQVIVRLLTETGLQYSTFYYHKEETNFSLFCKISTNANLEFGNRCFFKGMDFYAHKFFITVSHSCFKFTFISGSENHKSHDNFPSTFSISIKLCYGLRKRLFGNFQKMTIKKQHDGVYVLLRRSSREFRCFGGNFLELPQQTISRATVNDYF